MLTPTEKGRTDRPIAVRLGRIGGAVYWDATALPGEDHEGLRDQHLLPLHSIARIRVEGERLVVAPLRSNWSRPRSPTRRWTRRTWRSTASPC